MVAQRKLAAMLLVGALVVGCRVPVDSKAGNGRGANSDAGASSFAFFGGLKAFFVDDTPGASRPVNDDDLSHSKPGDTAPISTVAPTGIR